MPCETKTRHKKKEQKKKTAAFDVATQHAQKKRLKGRKKKKKQDDYLPEPCCAVCRSAKDGADVYSASTSFGHTAGFWGLKKTSWLSR